MLFKNNYEDVEFDYVENMEIKTGKISDFKFKYAVLVFYPLDFTFVCPTEIVKINEMACDFKKNETMIFFISTDSVYSHIAWQQADVEKGGIRDIKFPMVSDIRRKIASQFNLLNEEMGVVMRSTVILDKNLKTLHISANIDPIGRSSKEILRLIRAVDFSRNNDKICPVDFDYE